MRLNLHRWRATRGAAPSATVDQTFDITAHTRMMAERGEWADVPPKVTFIMRELIPPGGAEDMSLAAAGRSGPVVRVTIGRVVIATE